MLLRSEFEKELLEIRKKYDLMLQNVEMEIVQKQKECDGRYDRVYLNKLLAEFMIEKGNVNYIQLNHKRRRKVCKID